MTSRPKHGFKEIRVMIPENGEIDCTLAMHAEARNLTQSKALLAILGDWTDAKLGRGNPFGGMVVTSSEVPSTTVKPKESDAEKQAREARINKSAGQW